MLRRRIGHLAPFENTDSGGRDDGPVGRVVLCTLDLVHVDFCVNPDSILLLEEDSIQLNPGRHVRVRVPLLLDLLDRR